MSTIALGDLPAASRARLVKAALELPQAKGIIAPPSLDPRMNQLEQRYAGHLDSRIAKGELAAWWFEAVTLRLADDATSYRPDFMLLMTSGLLEFHETKGHWRDDARAKIKVAAALYPCFTFRAVQAVRKAGGVWMIETLSRRARRGATD